MTASDRELEVALVVRDDDPADLARRIADLEEVDRFRLMPADSQRIRDTYYDTPEGLLARERLALRVREVDGAAWLALKGEARGDAGGVPDRLEVEGRWSAETLDRIDAELARRGIAVELLPRPFPEDRAPDLVTESGLVIRQRRRTTRHRRSVVDAGHGPEPVAELAIDDVEFLAGDVRVRLREIEIEAVSPDAAHAVERLARAFEDRYPEGLRRWPHAKLPTGEALTLMADRGELADLLHADGTPRAEAFDRIERVLADEG